MQYTISNKIGNLVHFAANYDCNAYGAGTYNNDTCNTTTTTTDESSDPLSETGYNIIIPVALALALIIAAAILLFKKAMRKHKNAGIKP